MGKKHTHSRACNSDSEKVEAMLKALSSQDAKKEQKNIVQEHVALKSMKKKVDTREMEILKSLTASQEKRGGPFAKALEVDAAAAALKDGKVLLRC